MVVNIVACNLFLREPNSTNHSNLLAHFPFDKNADDIGPHQLKAKIVGATLVDGIKNKAYFFDGIDDYIEIENSDQLFNFEINEAYSISFWVKPAIQNDLLVHENDLLSKWVQNDNDTSYLQTGYPFCIRYLNENSGKRKGKWYLANWGGYVKHCESGNKVVGETKLSTDHFNHLVFTQNQSELKLYLNGNLVATTQNKTFNSTTCTTKNNASLRIGKRGGPKYQNHFTGVIDELKFYKEVLDEKEVINLYDLHTFHSQN